MRKERLLNVAKASRETKHPHMFDMTRWGWAGNGLCGTPGCNLGNYAFREDLQDAFKLLNGIVVRADTTEPCGSDSLFVMEHFDITQTQYFELFDDTGCGGKDWEDEQPDPLHVGITNIEAADYIEAFVREHG